jgi:hypothetical protein
VPALLWAAFPSTGWGQVSPVPPMPGPAPVFEDASRTRNELSQLLSRNPPSVRIVLGVDPTLLGNQQFLAPYPALAAFLSAHSEIAHNPSYYFPSAGPRRPEDLSEQTFFLWRDAVDGAAVFIGFGMAIGLITWLIRTFLDHRRWNSLARSQADFHTKLLDRFSASADLLAYIQSPAGVRFLQSTPITLDGAPRSLGAPVGRIMWSVQGGVVLIALGVGLMAVSAWVSQGAEPLRALGILGLALGGGFVLSAIIAYILSNRLGLIESGPRGDLAGAGNSGHAE